MIIYAYIIFGWYIFSIFVLGLSNKPQTFSRAGMFSSACIRLGILIPLVGRIVGWW